MLVKKRGQVQMETMLLVGLIGFAVLFLLYTVGNQIGEANKQNRAEDAVLSLIKEVDRIVALGTGSRNLIPIDMPNGVQSITVSGKKIIMQITSKEGTQTITRRAKVYMAGNVTVFPGLQQVHVQKVNETLVLLGPSPVLYSLDPQCLAGDALSAGIAVTLNGAGFGGNSQLLLDGVPFGDGAWNIVDPTTIIFDITWPTIPTGWHQVSVLNKAQFESNELSFLVRTPFVSCGEGEGEGEGGHG